MSRRSMVGPAFVAAEALKLRALELGYTLDPAEDGFNIDAPAGMVWVDGGSVGLLVLDRRTVREYELELKIAAGRMALGVEPCPHDNGCECPEGGAL